MNMIEIDEDRFSGCRIGNGRSGLKIWLLGMLVLAAATAADASRPNIVLVMADDPRVRWARENLLAKVVQAFEGVGDLTRIQLERAKD